MKKYILVIISIYFSITVAAGVRSETKASFFYLKVDNESIPNKIVFKICKLRNQNIFAEPDNCRIVGDPNGYFEEELLKDRTMSKWKAAGVFTGDAVLIIGAGYLALHGGFAAAGLLFNALGLGYVSTITLSGVTSKAIAAVSAAITAFAQSKIKYLNPCEYSRNAKVFSNDVLSNKIINTPTGEDFTAFIIRLKQRLKKIEARRKRAV